MLLTVRAISTTAQYAGAAIETLLPAPRAPAAAIPIFAVAVGLHACRSELPDCLAVVTQACAAQEGGMGPGGWKVGSRWEGSSRHSHIRLQAADAPSDSAGPC